MKKILSVLMAAICLTVCAFSFTACGDNNNGDDNQAHTTHNWSATYTENGDRHYQTCDGCDEKKYSNHDYGTSGVCVCGKQKPVEIHNHAWSEIYTDDGDRHYQTCGGCNEKKYNDHNYGTSGVCVCGKQKPVSVITVESVTLDKTELTLEIGETETLTASVAPDNATDKTVTYSVEPAGIVTVDNTGKVTAVAAGTATITATANGKTAECSVTVNAPLTNAQVLKYLNDNVLIKAAKGSLNSNWEVNETNVTNAIWHITKDGKNITGANLIFNYLRRTDTTYVILCNVEFTTPITPQNIQSNEIGMSTYTQVFAEAISPTYQTEHTALTNAICNKLFGENATATRYIVDNGFIAADPQYGDVATYTVIEITDAGIKESNIKITYASSDDGLIVNLNDTTKNATYGDAKNVAITGDKLNDNNEPFFGNVD